MLVHKALWVSVQTQLPQKTHNLFDLLERNGYGKTAATKAFHKVNKKKKGPTMVYTESLLTILGGNNR